MTEIEGEGKQKEEKVKKRCSIHWLTLQLATRASMGQTEARIREPHPGLPRRCYPALPTALAGS